MKKSLVITTVFPPHKDIGEFAKFKDWQCIIVADRKTPKDWYMNNVVYLSTEEHYKLFPDFSKILPWNMYSRKNIGYLYAIKEKSDIIAETDDDVSPYKNYPPYISKNKKLIVLSGSKFINIYSFFGGGTAWPRGFPLSFINKKYKIRKVVKKALIFIYNSVIDVDSDFDAIYRLTSNKPIKFNRSGEFALAPGSYCPLNSQNTFFHREAYPLLYIPSFIDARVADIWRGYIAQRILWELGGAIAFTYPTAFTNNRNAHDYMRDFEKELPLFLYTESLINTLASLSLSSNVCESLIKTYAKLAKEKFIKKEEVILVKAWVKEIEKYI